LLGNNNTRFTINSIVDIYLIYILIKSPKGKIFIAI
jgi:hypothetical protein